MVFRGNAPIDPSDPDSVPTVVEVTPKLVAQSRIEHEQARTVEIDSLKPLMSSTAQSQYLIGPADVLSIIVWDHPELMMPNLTYSTGQTLSTLPTSAGLQTQSLPGYVVSRGGLVQYPYIDAVHVGGLTELQAKQVIADKLRPYIRDPQVTVRVIGYRSKKVYVSGEVKTPGIESITDQASNLSDAIDGAGGIAATGDWSRVTLTRAGRTYRIDMPELLRRGMSPAKIQLMDGDVIKVGPLLDKRILAMGELNKPGSIPFRTDGKLTLSEAIADAGGINSLSANAKAIYVIRQIDNELTPEVFHLDAKSPTSLGLGLNFELRPKDVVYVDAPELVRWSRIIALLTGSASGASAISSAIHDATTPY